MTNTYTVITNNGGKKIIPFKYPEIGHTTHILSKPDCWITDIQFNFNQNLNEDEMRWLDLFLSFIKSAKFVINVTFTDLVPKGFEQKKEEKYVASLFLFAELSDIFQNYNHHASTELLTNLLNAPEQELRQRFDHVCLQLENNRNETIRNYYITMIRQLVNKQFPDSSLELTMDKPFIQFLEKEENAQYVKARLFELEEISNKKREYESKGLTYERGAIQEIKELKMQIATLQQKGQPKLESNFFKVKQVPVQHPVNGKFQYRRK